MSLSVENMARQIQRQLTFPQFISEEKALALATELDRLDGKEDGLCDLSDPIQVSQAVQNILGDIYQDSYVAGVTAAVNAVCHRESAQTRDCFGRNSLAMTTVVALPSAISSPTISFPAIFPEVAATAVAGSVLLTVGALAFAGTPQALNPEFQIGEEYRKSLEWLRGPTLEFAMDRLPMSRGMAGEKTEAPTPEELAKKLRKFLKRPGLPDKTKKKVKDWLQELLSHSTSSTRLQEIKNRLLMTESALAREKSSKLNGNDLRERQWSENSPALLAKTTELRDRLTAIRGHFFRDAYNPISVALSRLRVRAMSPSYYSTGFGRLKADIQSMETRIAAMERAAALEKVIPNPEDSARARKLPAISRLSGIYMRP